MANVPDNFTFGLVDVRDVIGAVNSLTGCTAAANPDFYDSLWTGETGMRRFRNYGGILFDYTSSGWDYSSGNTSGDIAWYNDKKPSNRPYVQRPYNYCTTGLVDQQPCPQGTWSDPVSSTLIYTANIIHDTHTQIHYTTVPGATITTGVYGDFVTPVVFDGNQGTYIGIAGIGGLNTRFDSSWTYWLSDIEWDPGQLWDLLYYRATHFSFLRNANNTPSPDLYVHYYIWDYLPIAYPSVSDVLDGDEIDNSYYDTIAAEWKTFIYDDIVANHNTSPENASLVESDIFTPVGPAQTPYP